MLTPTAIMPCLEEILIWNLGGEGGGGDPSALKPCRSQPYFTLCTKHSKIIVYLNQQYSLSLSFDRQHNAGSLTKFPTTIVAKRVRRKRRSRKRNKGNKIWLFCGFLVWYFHDTFCVGHEYAWRRMPVDCNKGKTYKLIVFDIIFWDILYCQILRVGVILTYSLYWFYDHPLNGSSYSAESQTQLTLQGNGWYSPLFYVVSKSVLANCFGPKGIYKDSFRCSSFHPLF